ncbi:ABC transporter substrate-binding protein [Metabacillus schmidteae]|uniref:ABC transporter substrate-binding protein n=1 Tax=Metabacillus schmidteae TaxID=2730405 RepID=UPI001589AB3B|nr:sugar ABC transporter substrate-binding protein [Metabacillus schmidteae]
MKKKWLILLLCVLFVFSLTACTSSSEETGGNDGEKDGKVVLRVMDWSDSTKDIREEFHKQFMEKYPDIKVEYTQLTIDQYKNTILTAVNSGEAPDLFPVPSGMKLSTLVKDGWYQSLEPYIDDEFKNIFVEGTFQNGITMVDGEVYSIPETAYVPSSLIFYNKKLFKEAGLDPEQPPKTYSEYREAAKKITEAGKGKYYGIIEGGKQSNRWMETVRDWSSLDGSGINANSPISLATNETTYDSEPVLNIFNLFNDIKEDGSFHPKTMNISAPEARALFGQGQAGFIVQGAWCIGVWNKENPDLEYGVMAPPVPDSGKKGSLPILSNSAWMGLSATSEHQEEAALYLKEFYGGDYFQQEQVKKGGAFSIVKGINEEYIKVEQLQQYYDISQEFGRVIPNPSVKNPNTSAVFAEFKDVSPNVGEILGGVVAGAVSDFEGELSRYSEQLGTAWNNALTTASEKGIEVEKSDFEFPNWDPLENYTEEDYAELK